MRRKGRLYHVGPFEYRPCQYQSGEGEVLLRKRKNLQEGHPIQLLALLRLIVYDSNGVAQANTPPGGWDQPKRGVPLYPPVPCGQARRLHTPASVAEAVPHHDNLGDRPCSIAHAQWSGWCNRRVLLHKRTPPVCVHMCTQQSHVCPRPEDSPLHDASTN